MKLQKRYVLDKINQLEDKMGKMFHEISPEFDEALQKYLDCKLKGSFLVAMINRKLDELDK